MENLSAVEESAQVYRQLAAKSLAANDLAAAYQHGERALEYARKTGNRLEEGITHRVLGQIAGEQWPPDAPRAAEHLAQSRAILEELGNEYELALTLTEEAALLEGDALCETLKRAREIFRRLGASVEAEGVQRLMAAFGCK